MAVTREVAEETVGVAREVAAVVWAAILARWMGTTAIWSCSGGFLRKGATIACGTLRIWHSWPLSGRPALSRGLWLKPWTRSTRRIGSVGRGLVEGGWGLEVWSRPRFLIVSEMRLRYAAPLAVILEEVAC